MSQLRRVTIGVGKCARSLGSGLRGGRRNGRAKKLNRLEELAWHRWPARSARPKPIAEEVALAALERIALDRRTQTAIQRGGSCRILPLRCLPDAMSRGRLLWVGRPPSRRQAGDLLKAYGEGE